MRSRVLTLFHISGPLHGDEQLVAIPIAPERLRYVYDPTPHFGYVPTLEDGDIEYRLDRRRSDLTPNPRVPGMQEGKATYVICRMPE